jgi:hypothetical protein
MRRALPFLILAACAPAPDPGIAARDALGGACAAAVAGHVGKPVEAVEITFRETAPDGVTIFAARDGDRVHDCRIDATGRVLRVDHV